MKLISVILPILLVNLCSAYKFLLIFPYPSKSHGILGEGHVRHLLNAGHQVTYMSTVLLNNTSRNLRQIDLSSNFKYYDLIMNRVDLKKQLFEKTIDLSLIWDFLDMYYGFINNTFANEDVQKLLHDPKEEYDAVIVEWLYSELFAGFSAVFNCPLIWFSSMEPHWMVLSLIDESPNTAYTPDHVSARVPPLTFFERAQELTVRQLIKFARWYFTTAPDEAIYKSNIASAIKRRGRIPPTFEEVKYNGSLMLGNSHISSGLAIRLPQNYKPISGYHINEVIKPLPEKFQKLMDNSKHGVIYFSLGSIVPGKMLPDEIKKELIKVFGSLKQTVIWKFEEVFPDLPKNLHVVNWAPQPSILAHPNCVLFITHGGLLSTTETIHYGKPIIGIPVFADQYINVKRAVHKGFGLEVELSDDMPEKLKTAIDEMLSNPKYTERVKEQSFIYHHRVAKPGAELVHWVEHVVQTRGAPHLRSPALYVAWYQKLYLDLLAAVALLVYVVVKTVKYLCCSGRKKADMRKKND